MPSPSTGFAFGSSCPICHLVGHPNDGRLHGSGNMFRYRKRCAHLLVCDRQGKATFLLTVIHASRDIPSRLAELAPTLATEAALLHEQLRQTKKR